MLILRTKLKFLRTINKGLGVKEFVFEKTKNILYKGGCASTPTRLILIYNININYKKYLSIYCK